VVAPKGDADLMKAIEQARAQGLSVIQLLGNDDLNSVPYATHQLVKLQAMDNRENLIAESGVHVT
jgi:ATP phosphoribosyltransferase regulatory subunit